MVESVEQLMNYASISVWKSFSIRISATTVVLYVTESRIFTN